MECVCTGLMTKSMDDNNTIIKIVCVFIAFTILFPVALWLIYHYFSYGAWYGILASFLGGSIGGITTLIALYISTSETRKIQK